MSAVKSSKVQVGISTNPGNNFVIDASQADGTLKISRGNVGATTQDVLKVDSTGTMSTLGLPAFQCRAWVRFDSNGVIRASGNVASVSRIATGNYRITLSTPMPDTNYAVIVSMDNDTTSTTTTTQCANVRTVESPTAFVVITGNTESNTAINSGAFCAVYR